MACSAMTIVCSFSFEPNLVQIFRIIAENPDLCMSAKFGPGWLRFTWVNIHEKLLFGPPKALQQLKPIQAFSLQ